MRNRKTPNDFIIEGNICKIGCYNNKFEFVGYAIIDAEDMEKCRQYKWYFCKYVQHIGNDIRIRLHNFILGIKRVDHINGNIWDCRKENLRPSTQQQNLFNKRKHTSNTSGYKGVCKTGNKWFAQIQKDNKHYNLGSYNTKEEAALAYNEAAKELFGEFACLNEIKPKLIKRVQCVF